MEPLKLFRAHFLLYLCEAAELALFMLSACVFTVLLFPTAHPWLSRSIMGTAMGLTAIAIIKSPMGKASGAHFNPAITLTFYHLGKIDAFDATFYILFQFLGAIFGVWISKLILGPHLAAVNYAVTIPGLGGRPAAFAAELFMAALLMAAVLITSNRPRLTPYTTWLVGFLIANYILFLAPVSGFSINPARTLGSAVFAHQYTGLWIYFTAPILGMMSAAEAYLRASTHHHSYFTHRHLTQREL
jgi:aquaporin Z